VQVQLEREPLLEGDLYPGDVLAAVLRVPPSYWTTNSAHLDKLQRILASVGAADEELCADIQSFRSRVQS
jgi:hypothetical protein